jgi:DNA polymerase
MAIDARRIRNIARQHLETTRFLGVDCVPVPEPGAPDRDTDRVPEIHTTVRTNPSELSTRPVVAETPVARAQGGPPELAAKDKPAALEAVRTRHDAECGHCNSVTTHTQTVFGEGNADADLMFVGEAPGAEEDRTGRPFVGRAGRKLDEIIEAMSLRREDVYIANVLKSRPPENRTPLPAEVELCAQFLAEQIRIIRPKVVVSLGGPATKFMLGTNVGITRLRGNWATYDAGDLLIPVMPTFHPAYLLRNYTIETRGKVWSDMQAALQRLAAE